MLQFIKKLFGFGKKEEVKTDVFVTTETPANSIVIPVGGKTAEEAKASLAEVIASHKEEIKFDETKGEVIFNDSLTLNNKPKEELEKVVAERISEIESKKPSPKKTAPKNPKQKEAEKAPVVEKKPSKPTPKKTGEKAPSEKKPAPKKATPKKDTKKGKN